MKWASLAGLARRSVAPLLLLPLLTRPLLPAPLRAQTPPAGMAGPSPCRAAIVAAEHDYGIPDQFLNAIGRVEAGRPDPDTGVVSPWPWTIDAAGEGHFYASKAEAIAAAQSFQARGILSLDIGCLQVNLVQHPEAFASLEQAFDPQTNVRFAARLLQTLFGQTGSWPHAAAAYHSQTPSLGADYQQKVLAAWAQPDGMPQMKPARPKGGPRTPASPSAPFLPLTQAASLSLVPAMGGLDPGGEVSGFAHRIASRTGGVPLNRGLAAYRRAPVRLALQAPRG